MPLLPAGAAADQAPKISMLRCGANMWKVKGVSNFAAPRVSCVSEHTRCCLGAIALWERVGVTASLGALPRFCLGEYRVRAARDPERGSKARKSVPCAQARLGFGRRLVNPAPMHARSIVRVPGPAPAHVTDARPSPSDEGFSRGTCALRSARHRAALRAVLRAAALAPHNPQPVVAQSGEHDSPRNGAEQCSRVPVHPPRSKTTSKTNKTQPWFFTDHGAAA